MLYNEKAYVTSKAYIKKALESPPQGLEHTLDWLYLRVEGPNLLKRIVNDSRMRLPENASGLMLDSGIYKDEGTVNPTQLSSGALILLRRSLSTLEQRFTLQQEQLASLGEEESSFKASNT